MTVEPISKKARILEQEGSVPKKAYYVVSGLVTVEGYVDGDPFLESIYRENTIEASNAFVQQLKSEHTVTATKGALVWSISNETVQEMYVRWPDTRGLVLQAAFNYAEMKKSQRSRLLAMPEMERVREFYRVFKGLQPAYHSRLNDRMIASYLAMLVRHLRNMR